MKYNSGNYEKYMTKNPLKRALVNKLNNQIVCSVGHMIEKIGENFELLDAGCGEGFIDTLLKKAFPNIRITGVEYTREAITVAQNKNPNVTYIQGDITKLNFEDNQYDIVICTEVLEHIYYPHVALSELERVSKGNILITVPHEPWFCLGNLFTLRNISRLGNPIDHVNHWTKTHFLSFYYKIVFLGGVQTYF